MTANSKRIEGLSKVLGAVRTQLRMPPAMQMLLPNAANVCARQGAQAVFRCMKRSGGMKGAVVGAMGRIKAGRKAVAAEQRKKRAVNDGDSKEETKGGSTKASTMTAR